MGVRKYGFGQIIVSRQESTCTCGDCGLVMSVTRLLPEESAVIKSAKVWAQTAGNSAHGTSADLDLYEAIEALQAAEAE